MHVFKMPSMKEVSLKVFASLAFCASFYYFNESMTEKNRRSIFGWAFTGICEVLLLAQTKQLRMRIYNSPTSISLWTAIRFILGVASYFFWFLLGILGRLMKRTGLLL
ncbi:hypothetical protein CKAN_01995600 [Cinnamomum micranthum f. kanehirae]|uniref:Uncharacterized protein n=1 Tax=Cinnamomum micranthum f. kanehirae TaxID=337451 RepID=A0A3S3PHP5_9MAGN|nr:hypothetical protein CKAN_01995600 [Cinnamomum micranthum f. kanehirae]